MVITGNVATGVGNGTSAFALNTTGGDMTSSVVANNHALLAANADCFGMNANNVSHVISDILFIGNGCVGTSAANQNGFNLKYTTSSAYRNVQMIDNSLALLAGTGYIVASSSITNTTIKPLPWHTVTTHFSDSGTGTMIQDFAWTVTGVLASGTATVTFPGTGFTSATSYSCKPPRDTTTPANALTAGTYTATTLVLTGTGTDAYSLSCGGN
jgi:hypothetical protein